MTAALRTLGILIVLIAGYISWDWPFLKRYATFSGDPMTVPVEWFQPQAPVKGDAGEDLPAAPEGMGTIDGAALEAAATFAEEQNSSALIVVRHGRVEFERYWDGATRDTTHNLQSMSKTVLGLTMGIAVAEGKISSIDDPISKYLTKWSGEPRGAITIKQMLWMARNDFERQRINGLRAGDIREFQCIEVIGSGGAREIVEQGNDCGGVERTYVRVGYVGPQFENPCPAVVRHLPRHGERRMERAVGIDPRQCVENRRRNPHWRWTWRLERIPATNRRARNRHAKLRRDCRPPQA